MTIAVLGPKGTFSHEIAGTVRDRDEEILFFPTIRDVFTAVTASSSEYSDLRGIVPVENSGAGGVFETLECLLKEDCTVCAEYYLPIRYVFALAKGKSADMQAQALTKVYAHPQAHAQCSVFLADLAGQGNAAVVHTTSNAKSAEETLNDVSELTAAVTTRSAAEIYGLEIIRGNIQNYDTNTTRFLEIRKTAPAMTRKSPGLDDCTDCNIKCSIVVMPKGDYPGLLYRILSVFAGREINLTRIESRPSGDMMGKYVFFIDYEFGSELDADGNRKLLDWLRTITEVKELGCYPKANQEGQ
ncbi:MAG: prephenate dehydratase [Methanomicrobium sp.]|nr:prephenate dehydratase [Methanomicrobium sp.]